MGNSLFHRIPKLVSESPGNLFNRARGHIRYLNLWRKNEIVRFYEKIKEEKHIFIFSVLGRTSSTAFQRILNSSGEICIFGETKTILEKLIAAFLEIEGRWDEAVPRAQMRKLKYSHKTGSHNQPYPRALDLEAHLTLMPGIIASLFRPVIRTKRFGFKEIHSTGLNTIRTLRRLFPKSRIVFLFRDPLDQFLSVSSTAWWEYSGDADGFIDAYTSCASNYSTYTKEDSQAFFLENTYLYHPETLSRLLQFLSISSFDKTIINDRVFSFDSKRPLDQLTRGKILESEAYEVYRVMQGFCNSFMKGI